jgi:hypothetical protein
MTWPKRVAKASVAISVEGKEADSNVDEADAISCPGQRRKRGFGSPVMASNCSPSRPAEVVPAGTARRCSSSSVATSAVVFPTFLARPRKAIRRAPD